MTTRIESAKPYRLCTHDEIKWGRKKEVLGGKEIVVCGRCREEIVCENQIIAAAAYEMYTALEAIVQAFDNDTHMPRTYSAKGKMAVGYGEASAMTRAKNALAKARGQK